MVSSNPMTSGPVRARVCTSRCRSSRDPSRLDQAAVRPAGDSSTEPAGLRPPSAAGYSTRPAGLRLPSAAGPATRPVVSLRRSAAARAIQPAVTSRRSAAGATGQQRGSSTRSLATSSKTSERLGAVAGLHAGVAGGEPAKFPTGVKNVGSSSLLVKGAEMSLCCRQLCGWSVLGSSL